MLSCTLKKIIFAVIIYQAHNFNLISWRNQEDLFFKKGLAGAILLGTASVAKAGLPDPVKPKAAKAVNPFHLGMAGYTFVNFDLETTLKTLQRPDIHYLCIKDFHLPLDSNDDQIKAFHDKCASYGVTGYAVGPIYMKSEAGNRSWF